MIPGRLRPPSARRLKVIASPKVFEFGDNRNITSATQSFVLIQNPALYLGIPLLGRSSHRVTPDELSATGPDCVKTGISEPPHELRVIETPEALN